MKCRICGHILDQRICHLPDMPLTDEFVPLENATNEFIHDIGIYQCGSCGLVQNPVDFDHESYYQNYEYSSGHSEFTRTFMRHYALAVCDAFQKRHGRLPESVLEIGSGDGEQLRIFQQLGVSHVLGVEPSDALVRQSVSIGVPAYKGLFSCDMIADFFHRKFDICLSSYTLDHVRNPSDYLRAAHELLITGGILAFEVHDLARIAERGEWCLFEHEHTIYMDAKMAQLVAHRNGFEVAMVNPLPESVVRANSLIVIAQKNSVKAPARHINPTDYSALQMRIDTIINRIDDWIDTLPSSDRLVGYGAGGRGVMTLAALQHASRFEVLFDSNHLSERHQTPKTHITVSGTEKLIEFRDSWCFVFSFGYMKEITSKLTAAGYCPEKIVSLKEFLE